MKCNVMQNNSRKEYKGGEGSLMFVILQIRIGK